MKQTAPIVFLLLSIAYASTALAQDPPPSQPGVRLPEFQPRIDIKPPDIPRPEGRAEDLDDDIFRPVDPDAPIEGLDDLPEERLSPEEAARRARIRAERRAATDNETPAGPPLYQQHPPHQVVVAEIGTDYILTRLELDRMLQSEGARFVHSDDSVDQEDAAGMATWREKAEETGIKMQRRMESETLNEWAVVKALVLLARRENLTVTAEELDAALQEMSRKAAEQAGPSEGAAGMPGLVRGIPEEQLRREIAEGLLVDKFILNQLRQRFTEQDLQNLFLRNPVHFSKPPRVHAWQIVRKLERNMSDEEIRDLRKDFYKLAKKLRRKDGEDFAETAAVESDAANAAVTRGDLGWVELPYVAESERRGNAINIAPTTFDEEIVNALQRLEPGDVSDIVQTRMLLHILYVSEKDPGSGLQYTAEARERVIDSLIQSWKKDYGQGVLREAARYFPVRLNPSGLRLVSEPPEPFEPAPEPRRSPAEERPVIPVRP